MLGIGVGHNGVALIEEGGAVLEGEGGGVFTAHLYRRFRQGIEGLGLQQALQPLRTTPPIRGTDNIATQRGERLAQVDLLVKPYPTTGSVGQRRTVARGCALPRFGPL